MRRTIPLLTIILVGLVASACKPHYDGLEIRYLDGIGVFDTAGLEVVEGQARALEVEPISDNPHEDYENFDLVELVSLSPTVLTVAPSTDVDRFVLIGVAAGTTAVEVRINDDKVDILDARVVAQPTEGQ